MAMTKESMAAFIITQLEALADNANQGAQQEEWIEAFCQGIIDEIVANGVATGTDTGGDSHSLDLS